MQCCPTSILDLGCFDWCGTVPLDGLSVTGGKMVTTYNGLIHIVEGDFSGEIPIGSLNWDYTYTVQFYDSNGDVIVIGDYDGFRFKLSPRV
jgi:hypothetical protein